MKGLEAWLPELKGTSEPTEVNTMLAIDGRYYDPNQLESYFVKSDDFWGVNRSYSGSMVVYNPGMNAVVKLVIP